MLIKFLMDEDFVNYKKCSMFIGFPYCTFKCDRENGVQLCHNSQLTQQQNIDYPIFKIVDRYINNPLTHAIVFGGLEPFDSFQDLFELIKMFREQTEDDIVVYTGYYLEEIEEYINLLKQIPNIVIKVGRYIPNRPSKYDEILGVTLASDNQYGVLLS